MEQKIIKRIDDLTIEINDLVTRREALIKELKALDLNLDIKSNAIFELKNLLDSDDPS